jgi:hypothetical protein
MVAVHCTHTRNRTIKPFAIVLSGTGRGMRWRDGGGETNQCSM